MASVKQLALHAAILAVFLQALPALLDSTSDKTIKTDNLVLEHMECAKFTVLVSDYDAVIFKKGYGLANRESIASRLGLLATSSEPILDLWPTSSSTMSMMLLGCVWSGP